MILWLRFELTQLLHSYSFNLVHLEWLEFISLCFSENLSVKLLAGAQEHEVTLSCYLVHIVVPKFTFNSLSSWRKEGRENQKNKTGDDTCSNWQCLSF